MLGCIGSFFALLAIVLGILGQTNVAVSLVAVAIISAIIILLIIHRFIVKKSRSIEAELKSAPNYLHVEDVYGVKTAARAEGRTKKSEKKSQRSGKAIDKAVKLGNSIKPTLFAGGVGPDFEFAERASKARGRLETFALRTKSEAVREPLARAATNLQYGVEDVMRILRAKRAGMLPGIEAPANWDAPNLLTLARVLANQRHSVDDLEDAEVIFNQVRRVHGEKALGRTDRYVYAEVLQELGNMSASTKFLRDVKLKRQDKVHVQLMEANRFSAAPNQDWNRWIEKVNKIFTSFDLEPIGLNSESDAALLDSITCKAPARTVEGPLVSVLIPSFQGADFIDTSLRSITNQTWKNLEIIVVDDGSGDENRDRLTKVCASYPEVQLYFQEENLGAYPARNVALSHARGDFVTVHDDDDWSHPQKIQIQVEHLIENPSVLANMSRHVRTTPELRFTRINNNPSLSQPNFSSLMVRRDVFEKVGKWDDVSRGADAEFKDRLIAATGTEVPVLLKAPLSFTRTHEKSLTAGEMQRGYVDPARLFYQASYQAYHRANHRSSALSQPNFARPLNMEPGIKSRGVGSFDVVFATDFVFPGGTSSLTLNEIEAAANSGLRVGLLHLFSPVNAGTNGVTLRAISVAQHPNVEVLSLSDEASVSLLVVRHPSVLQFTDQLRSNMRVGKLVVIVNTPLVLQGGKGYCFDLSTVAVHAENVFGVTPELVSETGVTQKFTKAMVRSSELSDAVWPGFVYVEDIPVKEPTFSEKPVVGRHSRDSRNKWPTKLETTKSLYTDNDVYDVKTLGGIESLPAETQKILKSGSTSYAFNEVPMEQFLVELDFWVYFHADDWTESFGMAIVEAMAAGLVVILPEYMQANFGDGAVYAKPNEVKDVVARFWDSPAEYRAQAAKALAFVKKRYSHAAFEQRVAEYRKEGQQLLQNSEYSEA